MYRLFSFYTRRDSVRSICRSSICKRYIGWYYQEWKLFTPFSFINYKTASAVTEEDFPTNIFYIYIYIYIYTYIYILRSFKSSDDSFRLSYSIAFYRSIRPFLDLFHSWLYIFHLSRFSGDGLVFSFLQVSSELQFLVVALGPFSRHDHTK